MKVTYSEKCTSGKKIISSMKFIHLGMKCCVWKTRRREISECNKGGTPAPVEKGRGTT